MTHVGRACRRIRSSRCVSPKMQQRKSSEVKKAGTEGGTAYSDEFNKQVGKDVGGCQTVSKTTKGGDSGRQQGSRN